MLNILFQRQWCHCLWCITARLHFPQSLSHLLKAVPMTLVACDDWGASLSCYADLKYIEHLSANNLLTYEKVRKTESGV